MASAASSTATAVMGAGLAPRSTASSRNAAAWKRYEVGRFTHQFDVGAILPLENLPDEGEFPLFIPIAQAIAHQATIQTGGELGGKVTHLVSMAEDDNARLLLLDHRTQGERIAVRRVLGEQGRIDRQNLLNRGRREVRRERREIASQKHGRDGGPQALRKVLSGRQGLPGGAGQLAALMFRKNQNVISHFQVSGARC